MPPTLPTAAQRRLSHPGTPQHRGVGLSSENPKKSTQHLSLLEDKWSTASSNTLRKTHTKLLAFGWLADKDIHGGRPDPGQTSHVTRPLFLACAKMLLGPRSFALH